ncbi:MAG TPA: hypothetical protein VFT43_06105, partial [Candidatus Polarisedimenticolia bacterium]|nr:hypothetical protein [Candidatus Polarisedimenticolia bacterium]
MAEDRELPPPSITGLRSLLGAAGFASGLFLASGGGTLRPLLPAVLAGLALLLPFPPPPADRSSRWPPSLVAPARRAGALLAAMALGFSAGRAEQARDP